MIKVQLCPPEELENPLWWVPDAALAAVVVVAGYLGAQHYLGSIQEEIDKVEASAASLKASDDALKPELAEYKNIENDTATLNSKLNALKKITVSKILRYKPLIALEHFQNLKPEGVWFKALDLGGAANDEFDLTAQAFDNLIVAEFMTAIRATDTQDKDDGDLRTQIAFSGMTLTESVSGGKAGPGGVQGFGDAGGGGSSGGFSELSDFPVFHLKGHIIERTTAALKLNDAAPGAGSASGSGSAGASGSGTKKQAKPGPAVSESDSDNEDLMKF